MYKQKEHGGRGSFNIQLISFLSGILFNIFILIALYSYNTQPDQSTASSDQLFGGSGGGGGSDKQDTYFTIEFGESGDIKSELKDTTQNYPHFTLIRIHVLTPEDIAQRTIKPPPKRTKTIKAYPPGVIAYKPIRRIRGSGNGIGGGFGGGSGGGIGSGIGSSIDWGGGDGRRLLSGRIPSYPKDTDRELSVILDFSVLPDGTVLSVSPVRKSDEVLEREAIAALQTWRFESVPSQLLKVLPKGKVTFKFTLK